MARILRYTYYATLFALYFHITNLCTLVKWMHVEKSVCLHVIFFSKETISAWVCWWPSNLSSQFSGWLVTSINVYRSHSLLHGQQSSMFESSKDRAHLPGLVPSHPTAHFQCIRLLGTRSRSLSELLVYLRQLRAVVLCLAETPMLLVRRVSSTAIDPSLG